MKFLLLLLLAIPAYSQLPDRGLISDLKGKTRVYVIAEGDAYKVINKAIAKSLTVVNSEDAAEFFLEYKTVSRSTVGPTGMSLENGQLDAWLWREKKKVIAWSDSTTGGGFKGDTANKLIKRFLKDFKK